MSISQYGTDLKEYLTRQYSLSNALHQFIHEAFRVRCKTRDSGEYTLQIRHDPVPPEEEQNLEQFQQELRQQLVDWHLDRIIIEYKECCCTGCKGCQRFLGEI